MMSKSWQMVTRSSNRFVRGEAERTWKIDYQRNRSYQARSSIRNQRMPKIRVSPRHDRERVKARLHRSQHAKRSLQTRTQEGPSTYT